MTQNEKQMSNAEQQKKIGKRFKELIKEFDGDQETTAQYLNYSKTSISRFCSGVATLPDAAIEKIARKWGVRKEYIQCVDDFKTDKALFAYINVQNKDNFIVQKQYLETLGFKIYPIYYLICDGDCIDKNIDYLRPYLFESDQKEYHKRSGRRMIALKKPITNKINDFLPVIHKNTNPIHVADSDILYEVNDEGLDSYFIPAEHCPLGEDCEIAVCFEVYYLNLLIDNFSIAEIQNLFKSIDAYTKCTIEIFLKDYECEDEDEEL